MQGRTVAQSDLIVIGTGSAAGSVAYPCQAAGWSVTVIDSRPFGATCQLRGCDPKKVLVGGAELVDWNPSHAGKGVSADSLTINWAHVMRFKRTFTDPVPEQQERSFAAAGIGAVRAGSWNPAVQCCCWPPAAISFTTGCRRAAVWREAHHARATSPVSPRRVNASPSSRTGELG